MLQDQNTVMLKFDPDSLQDLQDLSKRLNTSITGVISQALALLKVAQGKTIILKEKTTQTTLEIKKFAQ